MYPNFGNSFYKMTNLKISQNAFTLIELNYDYYYYCYYYYYYH